MTNEVNNMLGIDSSEQQQSNTETATSKSKYSIVGILILVIIGGYIGLLSFNRFQARKMATVVEQNLSRIASWNTSSSFNRTSTPEEIELYLSRCGECASLIKELTGRTSDQTKPMKDILADMKRWGLSDDVWVDFATSVQESMSEMIRKAQADVASTKEHATKVYMGPINDFANSYPNWQSFAERARQLEYLK